MIGTVTKAVGGREQLLDIGILGGSRAIAALLGFLAVTMIARLLDPVELGLWGIALAVQGYVLQLGDFGLRSVVTAEAGRKPGRARYLLRRYLCLRLAITAVVFALLLVGTTTFVTADRAPLVLVAATAFIITLQLDWVDLAEGRMAAAAALQLARPFFFLVMLVLIPGVHTASHLAIVLMVAWALSALWSWSALWRARPRRMDKGPSTHGMLRLGWPLMIVAVLGQAQLSLDLLLVGWLDGPALAGHYYLAAAIVSAGLVIANAIGQQAIARLATGEPDPQQLAERLGHRITLIGFLILPIVIVVGFIAPALVPWLFGADHADAAPLLVWFLPWFVLQSITTALQGGLIAARRQSDLLRANVTMVLVTLPALGMAALVGDLGWFALARAAGEAARLVALVARLNSLERQICVDNLRLPLALNIAVIVAAMIVGA